MTDLLLLAHEVFCAVLIYTVFCRAVHTDRTVRLDVRLAFFCLGLVACIGLPAPLVWAFAPSLFSVLLLGVIAVVQVVTAAHWRNGVPHPFYKAGCTPRRRTCDRGGKCNVG